MNHRKKSPSFPYQVHIKFMSKYLYVPYFQVYTICIYKYIYTCIKNIIYIYIYILPYEHSNHQVSLTPPKAEKDMNQASPPKPLLNRLLPLIEAFFVLHGRLPDATTGVTSPASPASPASPKRNETAGGSRSSKARHAWLGWRKNNEQI